MFADEIFRITKSDETELTDIVANDNTLWERAASLLTSKANPVSFRNTRRTGGDGVNYPVFSAAKVLPSLKAYGNHTKHKAEALWGRYVPCDGITNASSTSIDTGLNAVDNMEICIRFKTITGSFYIFQARQSGTATIYGISGSQSGNTINAYGVTSGISRTAGHIYTVKMTMVDRAVTLYVKDETAGTEDTKTGTAASGTYSFPSPTTIKLFGDASKVDSGVTVYRAYIKVDGQMAWDMYPAVDVVDGDKAVAYDDVTHKASVKVSGSFTGGDLLQPVAYLQTDGNAYIDTDLLLDGSEKWTLRFASLKAELSTPVAGSLNGGTAFTNKNNYCVTYTTAITPHAYSVYADGNAGSSNNSWNGGLASDKAWHTIEYFGNVNTPPKIDGANMTQPTLTTLTPVTPSVPWRLFGRATTAKGQGTTSQDGVAIARFTGDTWDYIPVRVGTTVELLDLVEWKFATRTGTLTAGADIPYAQFCPEIIKVNTGDIQYGQYGKNLFDKNNRTRIYGYFASTGTTWAYNASAYSNKIPCKPNTTYTARYNGNSTQAVLGFGSCSTDEEPSASTGDITVTQCIRQNSPTINTPITITTGANDKWLIVAYNVAEPQNTDMADNLQIEEGSTATPYEPYKYGLHTEGSHTLTLSATGQTDIVRDIPMLLSEDSFVDVQSASKSEAWAVIWYDGTQTVPDGYISQTGDLTANQIVIYPLAEPVVSPITISPVELGTKANWTVVSEAEIAVTEQAEYLGK